MDGGPIGLMQGLGPIITDADDAFLAIVGRTRGELERGELNFEEMTPPEWHSADDAGMYQSAQTGTFTTPYDKEFLRGDGTRVRVTLACGWLGGSADRWFGFVIDVAALAPRVPPRADQALVLADPRPPSLFVDLAIELARERANRGAMLDNVNALIWSIDTQMRLMSANQAFFDVMVDTTGQPAKVGRSLVADDVPYPDELTEQRDLWRSWYRRALDGESISVPSTTVFPFGRREYENVMSPIRRLDTGEVVGAACVSLDVTRRVRAEEALRGSEQRFRALAEAAPIGIFQLDPSGLPVFMNDRCVAITGRDVGSWIIGERRSALHPDDLDSQVATFSEAIERAEPSESTYRLIRPDGSVRHVRQWLTPMRDDVGAVTGFVGTMDDQTDRVLLAARLAQRERLESLGTLAGGIAHDFNNTLAVVLGYAELALADVGAAEYADDSVVRASLEHIRTASVRARDMVRQILAFSRRSERVVSPVDVAELIDEGIRLMKAGWPVDVRCTVDRPPGAVVVSGDASALQRVFMNLCANARDAVQDNAAPEVWIRVRAAHGDAVLEVIDNGHGIAEDALDHIFEPFFSTKSPGDGTGMGLAVAHGIVAAHGGTISVESRPGHGSTFTVTLPLAAIGTPAADVGDQPPGDAGQPTTDPTGPVRVAGPAEAARVLVAEDEPAVAEFLRAALQRAGFHVVVCANGEEAVARFSADPDAVDVVLSDVVMPGMGGDRVAAHIRRERPDLPVILMTGYSSTVTPEYAERLGVAALLHKPISVDDIVAAVRGALAGGG